MAGSAAAAYAPKRPRNLVFILADDHRFDALGCAGHPWLKTPHLDRMAAAGARFANAFVTTSLCSPSRATILTGQYAHAHNVIDNSTVFPANAATFPKLAQRAGYRTAFIGKWHMGDESDAPQPGFDSWFSFRGQGEYVNPRVNANGKRERRQGHMTDILTEEAVRFLDQEHKKPFLLYLSHKAVHAPFRPAERHAKLYADAPVPVPATAAKTEENYRGKPEWLMKKRGSRHGLDRLYEGEYTLESLYRDYCGALAGLDDSVGAVREALSRRGLLDNTVLVYMGDNGYLMGEHGLVDKRVMYEPSVRIPMLMEAPGIVRPGEVREEFALNLDICATMLDAAGLPAGGAHGRSLLDLWRSGAPAWRTDFLYEYFWEWEALHTPSVMGLRTAQHSYMEYQGIWDINELYDMKKDPDQRRNLIGEARVETEAGGIVRRIADPETRKLVERYRARMVEILAATGGRQFPSWRA